MHIQCVSHSIFHSGQHFTLSFSTYSSHSAVVPTRLLIAHPLVPALGTYTRWRGAFSSAMQDSGEAFSTGIQYGGGAFSTPET